MRCGIVHKQAQSFDYFTILIIKCKASFQRLKWSLAYKEKNVRQEKLSISQEDPIPSNIILSDLEETFWAKHVKQISSATARLGYGSEVTQHMSIGLSRFMHIH